MFSSPLYDLHLHRTRGHTRIPSDRCGILLFVFPKPTRPAKARKQIRRYTSPKRIKPLNARSKRHRARHKKDALLQSMVPQEGTCGICGTWKPLAGHHILPRRLLATRHDPENILPVCVQCHSDIHSLSAAKLLEKYPNAKLRSVWEDKVRQKRKVQRVSELLPLPTCTMKGCTKPAGTSGLCDDCCGYLCRF